MRKAQKLELMIDWFHQNYEDPAESTPYETAEGGYQWIWGGPYDATDELYTKFGGVVSESLIAEAVEQIEADGLTDWAPVHTEDDYDEREPADEPISLDFFRDEPSTQYGSRAERRERARAKDAVDELRRALESRWPIGIGHNHPPEEVPEEKPEEITALRPALEELSAELAKANPAIALVKRWATPLRNAVMAGLKWGGKKVDTMLDEAAKTTGKALAAGAIGIMGTHYYPAITNAFDAVVNWLRIAARTMF